MRVPFNQIKSPFNEVWKTSVSARNRVFGDRHGSVHITYFDVVLEGAGQAGLRILHLKQGGLSSTQAKKQRCLPFAHFLIVCRGNRPLKIVLGVFKREGFQRLLPSDQRIPDQPLVTDEGRGFAEMVGQLGRMRLRMGIP